MGIGGCTLRGGPILAHRCFAPFVHSIFLYGGAVVGEECKLDFVFFSIVRHASTHRRKPAPRGMASVPVSVPVRCSLFTGTVPVRCSLFAGTVPVRCFLFTGTVPADNLFLIGNPFVQDLCCADANSLLPAGDHLSQPAGQDGNH